MVNPLLSMEKVVAGFGPPGAQIATQAMPPKGKLVLEVGFRWRMSG